MRIFPIKKLIFPALLLMLTQALFAQVPTADTSAKKQIHIIRAERLNFQKINDSTEYQSLAGNVVVKQQQTTFYCDSAVLNKRANILEAFGHVHINDADSVQTYADYARYEGKERKAFLKNNVKLTDGKGILTTPDLVYEVPTKQGIYTKGGKLVNGNTVLTSTEGYYYGETRDVIFKKKVVLIDPDYTIHTDTLLYNTYTDVATFVVPTEIVSGKKKINASNGYYDLKNKKAYFGKRPILQDSTTTLIADEVASDDSTGFGEASGNVIYKDTSQGVAIWADNLKTNNKKSSFLATKNPVMAIKQDQDSLFIAADTLFSGRLSQFQKSNTLGTDSLIKQDSIQVIKDTAINEQDSTKDRFFEAYHNVRIFSDSLQAVGDSLYYSSEDSVFRLFKDPIIWSQANQITGDTIFLYTFHKQPKRLYVWENAMAISKVTDSAAYYNQVKGRTINGYFVDGNIDYLRAKGNAESVYYGLDDNNKFIGVNKASSDAIDMYFENKKPEKVVFRNDLKGTSYPMGQVNHEELKIRNFKWQAERRPKSKFELLNR